MKKDRPRLVVYCGFGWRISAMRTTGKIPITAPPATAETPGLIESLSADILYIRLHGMEDQPYLYSEPGWTTALSVDQIKDRKDLFENTAVFLEGCEGVEMSDAFMAAGAQLVIGSNRTTYGKRIGLGPSSKIGRTWLKAYRKTKDATGAMKKAIKKVNSKYKGGWRIIEKRGIETHETIF